MPKTSEESNGNKPVHTVRHRNIKATIWRNESEKGGIFFNVAVTRSYQQNEEWHDSNTFGYDDLMNLAAVLYEAHAFISSLRAKDYAAGRGTERAAERRQRTTA